MPTVFLAKHRPKCLLNASTHRNQVPNLVINIVTSLSYAIIISVRPVSVAAVRCGDATGDVTAIIYIYSRMNSGDLSRSFCIIIALEVVSCSHITMLWW